MRLIDNFDIPPFLRTVWVSADARKTWEAIIKDCSHMVSELEILSVVENHRRCGWQSVNIQSLPQFEQRCAELGLVTLVVRYSKELKGFSHKFEPTSAVDNRTNVPVIFARNIQDAYEYKQAYDSGDHDKQGDFLGFPKCCREFFSEVWAEGYYDPIAQMTDSDNSHPYSNPILRYIGLRVGFHIPCSFHCNETIELAKQRMKLAYEKFSQQAKSLDILLTMPMSWDCLHGITVVRTPLFYIVTSSVPCEKRHVVKIAEYFSPEEAISGHDC